MEILYLPSYSDCCAYRPAATSETPLRALDDAFLCRVFDAKSFAADLRLAASSRAFFSWWHMD